MVAAYLQLYGWLGWSRPQTGYKDEDDNTAPKIQAKSSGVSAIKEVNPAKGRQKPKMAAAAPLCKIFWLHFFVHWEETSSIYIHSPWSSLKYLNNHLMDCH